MDTVALQQIQRALRLNQKLSDDEVVKLADLRRADNSGKRHVQVAKIDLREGEELMDFVWTMMTAVQTDRIVLADGSLDAWLVGIFNDHVVVEDGNTGRMFKSEFIRNEKGEISFSEPIEVRMVFVPVVGTDSSEEEVAAVEKAVEKAATTAPAIERIVEVMKSAGASTWGRFLPSTLRNRG